MGKLVGFRRFVSKKGDNYCVANVVSDYTERDKANGAVGSRTEELFIPSAQYDYLQASDIGSEIVLNYNFSGNRAYLDSVEVKRKK